MYARFRAPLDWHTDPDRHLGPNRRAGLDAALNPADVEAVRSSPPALFDGWAAPVLDLLRDGTAFVRRPLYVLPVSHTWAHVPGVTPLGDAAHLMPPLGVGANLAMPEGAELAESVAAASGPGDLDEAVRAFKEQMWARAGRWAKITAAGLERLVSPDPHRSPRPLRRSPAILTAGRESTGNSPWLHGAARHRRGSFRQKHMRHTEGQSRSAPTATPAS